MKATKKIKMTYSSIFKSDGTEVRVKHKQLKSPVFNRKTGKIIPVRLNKTQLDILESFDHDDDEDRDDNLAYCLGSDAERRAIVFLFANGLIAGGSNGGPLMRRCYVTMLGDASLDNARRNLQ